MAYKEYIDFEPRDLTSKKYFTEKLNCSFNNSIIQEPIFDNDKLDRRILLSNNDDLKITSNTIYKNTYLWYNQSEGLKVNNNILPLKLVKSISTIDLPNCEFEFVEKNLQLNYPYKWTTPGSTPDSIYTKNRYPKCGDNFSNDGLVSNGEINDVKYVEPNSMNIGASKNSWEHIYTHCIEGPYNKEFVLGNSKFEGVARNMNILNGVTHLRNTSIHGATDAHTIVLKVQNYYDDEGNQKDWTDEKAFLEDTFSLSRNGRLIVKNDILPVRQHVGNTNPKDPQYVQIKDILSDVKENENIPEQYYIKGDIYLSTCQVTYGLWDKPGDWVYTHLIKYQYYSDEDGTKQEEKKYRFLHAIRFYKDEEGHWNVPDEKDDKKPGLIEFYFFQKGYQKSDEQECKDKFINVGKITAYITKDQKVPIFSHTPNLGSSTNRWSCLYTSKANISNTVINGAPKTVNDIHGITHFNNYSGNSGDLVFALQSGKTSSEWKNAFTFRNNGEIAGVGPRHCNSTDNDEKNLHKREGAYKTRVNGMRFNKNGFLEFLIHTKYAGEIKYDEVEKSYYIKGKDENIYITLNTDETGTYYLDPSNKKRRIYTLVWIELGFHGKDSNYKDLCARILDNELGN